MKYVCTHNMCEFCFSRGGQGIYVYVYVYVDICVNENALKMCVKEHVSVGSVNLHKRGVCVLVLAPETFTI